MNTIEGTWLLRMKTPLGTIEADYRFEDEGGVLRGWASDGDGESALTDVIAHDGADGLHVTWRQRITNPLRLDLAYDVTVTGATLAGESKAGRLPSTPVSGERTGA